MQSPEFTRLEGISEPKSVVAAFARTRVCLASYRTLASAATVLRPFLVVSIAWISLSGLANAAESALSPARIYEQAKQASVEILVDGHHGGSGCFVSDDGLVLTAAHIPGRPGRLLEVLTPDGGRLKATVAAVDLGHDLILLRVEPREGGYAVLKLAAEVPLNTVKKARQVLDLAKVMIAKGNPASVTDAAVGAMMAYAAVKGAEWNVRINLQSVEDDDYKEKIKFELSELVTQSRLLFEEVDEQMEKTL